MGNTNWEEKLRKTLNSATYITEAKVVKGSFEFIFIPSRKNEKQAGLNKHKLEKLINTLKERVSLNQPITIDVKYKKITKGKIKYTVKASPYTGSTEQEKLNLFNNSSRVLCTIIEDYLYREEHIKHP